VTASKVFSLLFLVLGIIPAAQAQFIGIGGGRLLARDLGRGATGGAPRSEFHGGGLFALDVGFRRFPYGILGVHYSFARADLSIQRGDGLGSSADAEVRSHTVTFDTRLRTPFVSSFRFFGLAGAGVTRLGLDVKREVGTPFPDGAPGGFTAFVFTYGGGVERHLHQLVHLRVEVRDYRSPIPTELFRPGGLWGRMAVIGGITIGL
jgi:opacity protein-like surface antigen